MTSTPYFKLMHKDETLYEGNGHDWATLSHRIASAIKTAEEDLAHSRLTVDTPTHGIDASADLIADIASQFGIDNIEDYTV